MPAQHVGETECLFDGAGRHDRRVAADEPQIAFDHKAYTAFAGCGGAAAIDVRAAGDRQQDREGFFEGLQGFRIVTLARKGDGVKSARLCGVEAFLSGALAFTFERASGNLNRVIVIALRKQDGDTRKSGLRDV